ncbi:hypothetical protein MRB53_024511 [Persea americana]|uniref:Uncharacterized protein n=1 Tax=Persea americana TaxID=3435 RepID=A0ACC2LDE0_PERAE|nr:hypothetical protein MRB53_024511 [Persea americana]
MSDNSLPNFEELNELKTIAFCQPSLISWMCILTAFVTRIFKPPSHNSEDEVTKKILDNIKQWQDFSEINSGLDPYRYQLEWTRGTKPGTEQLQGDKTLTTLLQRKEVPSTFEANFMQESQRNPSTASHPSDLSSLAYLRKQTDICLHLPTALVLIEQKSPKQSARQGRNPHGNQVRRKEETPRSQVLF